MKAVQTVLASHKLNIQVNQVISKRMVKKQQMRWSKKGAHLLLQVRTKVIDGDWRETCERWYPELAAQAV